MKDRFSQHAGKYAAFRPTYPAELYDFIFSQTVSFDAAWDAGTGNGQVARDLARHFKRVIATDISAKQLENAFQRENISYSLAGEEISSHDNSFDLITVAQAIHWFDRQRFYREVYRVGRPGSLLAVWGYGLLRIDPEINDQVDHFYTDVVGPYWDKERKLIDDHYQTITFPFEEIKAPPFRFSFTWTLDEFQGYLGTWSSVQKYLAANEEDPVERFIESIRPGWLEPKTITFPLFMRIGRIKK